MNKVEIEWIPTKEKLPECGGNYLVCYETQVYIFEWVPPHDYTDGYNADGFWDPLYLSVDMVPSLSVKAWAYCPEPYKED